MQYRRQSWFVRLDTAMLNARAQRKLFCAPISLLLFFFYFVSLYRIDKATSFLCAPTISKFQLRASGHNIYERVSRLLFPLIIQFGPRVAALCKPWGNKNCSRGPMLSFREVREKRRGWDSTNTMAELTALHLNFGEQLTGQGKLTLIAPRQAHTKDYG